MQTIRTILARPGMLRLLAGQYLIYGQLFLAFTILPLYTKSLGGSAWVIGLHTTLFTGVGLLLRFVLGPLADMYGRKLPLLIGSAVFATTNLFLLLANDTITLGLVRIYQSIGLAAYLSASTALVLDLVPPALSGRALSLNRSVIALALLTVPAAAEQVIHLWGYPTLFIGAAAMATLGFLLLLSLPSRTPQRVADWRSSIKPLAAVGMLKGFGEVLRRPSVPAALGAMSASALSHVGASSFLPLRLQEDGNGEFGPYVLALGLAAFFSGLLGGLVDRHGPRKALTLSLLLTATGISGLYFSTSLPTLVVCGVLVGVGHTVTLFGGITWVDKAVSHRLRATAMATIETALDLGITLGFPILGALASMFGYREAFVALSLVCIVALVGITRQQEKQG